MKIMVGKLAGFCGGVTNSVNKTNKLLEEHGSMYCLGELVHNKQVVDELKDKGIVFVEDINDIPNGESVIIRAHGVPVSVYEEANKNNLEVFDLTCPKVLAIHDLAKKLASEEKFVVLIAQRKHPEAIGTISFCGDNSLIFESEDDLDILVDKYRDSNLSKIAILSQTTFSVKKFENYCELIKSKLDNVEIHNTICLATSKRQEETDELSKNVDAMVIIGGANSSNTKKLYEVSKNNNDNTFIAETAADLENYDFTSYDSVGVMAGASTPKKSIDEVIKYLEDVNK